MTTSSVNEKCKLVTIEKGKMYKGGDVVVLCVRNCSAEEFSFEGVVIHPGSENKYCIGTLLNFFNKNYFTDFHGEVVLKS